MEHRALKGNAGSLAPDKGNPRSTKRWVKDIYVSTVSLLNKVRKVDPSAAATGLDQSLIEQPHTVQSGARANPIPAINKLGIKGDNNNEGTQGFWDNGDGSLSSSAPSTPLSAVASPDELTGPSTNRTTTSTTPFPDKPRLRDENSTTNGNPEADSFKRDAIFPLYGDQWVVMTLDTGSDVNILPYTFLDNYRLEMEPLGDDENIVLGGFSAELTQPIQPLGILRDVDFHFARGVMTYTADFYVVREVYNGAILGRKTISEYGMLIPGYINHQGEVRTKRTGAIVNNETQIYGAGTSLIAPCSDSGHASALDPSDSKCGTTLGAEPMIEDDTRTTYSETSSTAEFKNESLVSELAEDLLGKIVSLLPDSQIVERILDILPDLLKAFALRIGYDAPTQINRDIMVFVHKYRQSIVTSLRNKYSDDPGQVDTRAQHSPGIPLEEFISKWLQGLHTHGNEPSAPVIPEKEDEKEESHILDIGPYRHHILRSGAYTWLLNKLHGEASLDTLDAHTSAEIRQQIISSLPSPHHISRRYSSEAYEATFELCWDPVRFVTEQRYQETQEEAMEKAITLTGSTDHAQALTCAQYLHQNWPSSGRVTIQLIKEVIRYGAGFVSTRKLDDGTALSAYLGDSTFIVKALGTADSVAEVGEQLAWLGAALRSSPFDSKVAYSVPYIETITTNDVPRDIQTQKDKHRIYCKINSRISDCEIDAEPPNGRCWHNLFRSPVIVNGFPIPRRLERRTGIEIQLCTMAALAQAQRMTLYAGKVCIKGFSVILVPTKWIGDTVIWHMLFNRDGSRISYTDRRILHLPGLYPENFGMSDVHTSRHILGWCSRVEDYTGAQGAAYNIGWSGLARSLVGCDFEKVSITRGNLIKGTATAAIGMKDRAVHLPSDDYAAQIRWIAKKYVTFYDVTDQRAWLVDGVSALLHLVRASLNEDQTDDSNDLFLFDSAAIVEAPGTLTAKAAAMKVLNNPTNKNLKLYARVNEGSRGTLDDNETYICFRDKVNKIYHLLEQIFDHQVQVNVELANGFRDDISYQRLEGFDFMDVATDEDQFWSHMAVLGPENTGWARLTRSVHAITLFGCDFGELIKPAGSERICPLWTEVPRGRDLLTTCVSNVNNILRRKVDGVSWLAPGRAVEDCRCETGDSKIHCDRIQVLLPVDPINGLTSTLNCPCQLEPHGAVIFGAGRKYPSLRENPDAATTDQSFSPERTMNSSVDSGIDLSLSSPRTTESGINHGKKQRKLSSSGYASTSVECSASPNSGWSSPRPRRPFSTADDPFTTNDCIISNGSCLNEKDYPIMEKVNPSGSTLPALAPGLPSNTQQYHTQPTAHETEYEVGWICALKPEFDAAVRMLDECHGQGFGHGPDNNLYTLGRIGGNNVVISCLPMTKYGNSTAAMVATRMMNKFPNIKIGFMVGIGGGIPNEEDDVRLGDIVVSKPSGQHGGVVQYDLGKATVDGFKCMGALKEPPEKLLSALNIMPSHGSMIDRHPQLEYPGEEFDHLYDSTYKHVAGRTCKSCDTSREVERAPGNRGKGPRVFYGTIASGNSVVRDGGIRETLRQVHGALCFEMESAGLINSNFPCLVIRGVSDYADSHKNDIWIEYAAGVAAQYARNFLCAIPGTL